MIKTFLSQVREAMTYDHDVVFATLQKKWEAIISDEETEDKPDRFLPLLGLANRLSATYGIYSARTDAMRISLVHVLRKCVDWASSDVEERKMFFKFAALPFVSKVLHPDCISHISQLDAFASAHVLEAFNAKFDDLELAGEEAEYEDNVTAMKKQLQHYAEKGGRTGIARKPKVTGATVGIATPTANKTRKRSLSKSRSSESSPEKEREEEEEEEEPEASLRSRKRQKGMLHSNCQSNGSSAFSGSRRRRRGGRRRNRRSRNGEVHKQQRQE